MRRESGFTLISVMIALVLLSVGVMALARAGGEVAAARTTSAVKTNAVAIARGHMEYLRSRPPQDLTSESPVQVDEGGVINGAGAYTRSVRLTTESSTLLNVKVIVDYPRATEPVEIVTLIYLPPVPT
jgi:type IV pilus assembly protein PilV